MLGFLLYAGGWIGLLMVRFGFQQWCRRRGASRALYAAMRVLSGAVSVAAMVAYSARAGGGIHYRVWGPEYNSNDATDPGPSTPVSETECAAANVDVPLLRWRIGPCVPPSARLAREGRLSLLRQGRGLWKGRQEFPDLAALRQELDQRVCRCT